MPSYLFEIDTGVCVSDWVQIDLGSPAEARVEAARTVGGMLCDIGAMHWRNPHWRIHVTDEDDATVCDLTIRGRTEDLGGSARQRLPRREGIRLFPNARLTRN